MSNWSDEQLTAHGVAREDEGYHPVSPGDVSWNESIFFDWISEDGSQAGHCRIGRLPGQGRLWVWLYVLSEGRWHCFDEPNLDLTSMSEHQWSAQSDQIRFEWHVERPLAASRLSLSCATDLPNKAGHAPIPISLDLRFTAAGPAHGMAAREVKGKDGQVYQAGRFEQPCDVEGEISLDGVSAPFQGRGERDHSWGPRYWGIQWMFLVLAGQKVRAQCTEVVIGGKMRVCVGYIQDHEMENVEDVAFALEFDDMRAVEAPYTGRVDAHSAGFHLNGTIEPLSGVRLDDSHCLLPNQRSLYTRHLVRFSPSDGGATSLGWLEVHRMMKPSA